MNINNIVRISDTLKALTGIGEEWLVDKSGEHVIAVFIDGNIKRANVSDNNADCDTAIAS
jgi:hypothetical protein